MALAQLFYTHPVRWIAVVLRAIWAGEHILLTLDLGRDPSKGGGGQNKEGMAIEDHACLMKVIKGPCRKNVHSVVAKWARAKELE